MFGKEPHFYSDFPAAYMPAAGLALGPGSLRFAPGPRPVGHAAPAAARAKARERAFPILTRSWRLIPARVGPAARQSNESIGAHGTLLSIAVICRPGSSNSIGLVVLSGSLPCSSLPCRN